MKIHFLTWFFCLVFVHAAELDLEKLSSQVPSDVLQEIFFQRFLISTELDSNDLYQFLSTNQYLVDKILDTQDPKLFVPLTLVVEKLLLENNHALLYTILNHKNAIDWSSSYKNVYYMGIRDIQYLTEKALGTFFFD